MKKKKIWTTSFEMDANINCVDMNQCLHTSKNNSDDIATYSNRLCSYSYICYSGCIVDSVICEEVHDCSEGVRSDTNARCFNTDESYQCECLIGFVGGGFVLVIPDFLVTVLLAMMLLSMHHLATIPAMKLLFASTLLKQ